MQTHSNRRGVALVIVLGFLVLLSGLAIAFFSSVTTELGASRTYSDNITTRQLADSAVNLVMGQIREATARESGVWASQPGMIRVYRDGNGSPSAKADAFFKLYSAKNMVVTDFSGFDPVKTPAAFDPTDAHQDVAKDWDKFPALFADLNAPVSVSDPANPTSKPQPVFPIVDPRAWANVNGTAPTAANPSLVEGFSFSPDVNRAVASGDDSDKWMIPMPVRWIYVLRDGTLTVPVSQDGSGVVDKWYSASTAKSDFRYPTKENPIVGRMAFWADDDTSKVNINTAGGRGTYTDNGYNENNYAGSFWDTPRFNHLFDMGRVDGTTGELVGTAPGGLASTQPFQKEFQRYPGHPATTSMGAVFARLLTSDQIYRLSPVLNYYDPNSPGVNNTGGSRGGTVRVDKNKAVELLPRQERLYASLDELLYADKPMRDGKRELNDKFIDEKGSGLGVITPDKLEKMRFFLTPHSRSPDLNLFGLPRISIWPVNQAGDEAEGRNVFDRAITYCSTVGGQKFIFTRSGNNGQGGAVSTTMDIGASLQKSGRWITRNKNLMEYLRALTGSEIPGFGGKFVTKYGAANRDMILGEIFDYIRIANLRDTTKDMDAYWFAPSGTVFPSRKDMGWGTGKIGGFGRFSTIYEASIVFYCTGVSTDNGNTWTQDEIADFAQRKTINRRRVSAFFVFSTFNPMQGYAPITAPWRKSGAERTAYFMPRPGSNPDPNKKYGPSGTSQRLVDEEKMVIKLTDISGFMLAGQPLDFPEGAINKLNLTSGQTWGGRNFGGYEGFFHTLQGHDGKPPNESQRYQFHSNGEVSIAVDPLSDDPNPTVEFGGGEVTVNIYAGFVTNTENSQNGDPIQKIKLNFPEATVPIPARWYWRTTGGFVKDGLSAGSQTVAAESTSPKSAQHLHYVDDTDVGRIAWTAQHSGEPDQTSQVNAAQRWRQIIQPGDVVRSLVYGAQVTGKSSQPNGDLRLLVLSENVDETKFNKHPDYDNSNLRFAQGLRMADGQLYITPATAVVDLDAPVDQTLDTRTRPSNETTAFGRHVVGLNLNNANKAMMLPSSQDKTTRYVDGIIRNDKPSRKFLGDFDTGLGVFPDGPYAGKQDEGNVIFKYFDYTRQKWIFPTPYKGNSEYEEPGDIFFSPNRQMPSAVLFGSLLSRPRDNRPWETLAFSPNTAGAEHPGNFIAPMDHLLLDLFTMPIVEPYLMSEPLSTAGRVSLNYQIAPFGYIQRSTGLRAALHPLRVTAVHNDLGTDARYKAGTMLTDTNVNPRKPINRDETIAAFDAYFKQYSSDSNKGFFKSASQICERFLYPQGQSFNGSLYDPASNPLGETSIRDFWNNHRLTGDNVREKPYADLYPRVTTKSNTYTVHMRVQTIRQVGLAGDYSKWKEGRDVVVGEYRGSTTIERFIDASDPKVVDRVKTLTSNPQKQTLEDLYRFRVIDTKKFSP